MGLNLWFLSSDLQSYLLSTATELLQSNAPCGDADIFWNYRLGMAGQKPNQRWNTGKLGKDDKSNYQCFTDCSMAKLLVSFFL